MGYIFKNGSEVDVLLKLYLQQGPSMSKMLNGQFAIAIWDGRTRTLHLIRDPFGIRPLYWWSQGDTLVFGSEIKTIAANPDVPMSIEPKGVLQTLRLWTCSGTRTAFQGIHQVPPGNVLTWRDRSIKLDRFWEWPRSNTQGLLNFKCDEEYFEAFRDEFKKSVQRQMMADIEVGAYLSGGIMHR